LEEHATGIPWFIPEFLVGLGMVDHFNELSIRDRKLASVVLHNINRFRPVRLSRASRILTHELVQDKIDNLGLGDCACALLDTGCPADLVDLAGENEKLYEAMCIESLLVDDEFLNSELQDDFKAIGIALARNKEIWHRADMLSKGWVSSTKRESMIKLENYVPLTNEDLMVEKRDKALYPIYFW